MLPAHETVAEARHLLMLGESPWQIAKALRLQLESLERAFVRAGEPIPWIDSAVNRNSNQ
ncbi:MAG TPA: hypothetical protein DCM51_02855 [Actinobacteria bacterium]|nr:hypothetical protein [Actinomycetota bacterium]